MPYAILQQGRRLIATVQGDLGDEELASLRMTLADRVGRDRIRGVIVDVTSVDLLDSFAARTLRDMSAMVRLRGADMVVAGIQPEVAMSMVQLGVRLQGVQTVLDLDQAVAALDRRDRDKAGLQG